MCSVIIISSVSVVMKEDDLFIVLLIMNVLSVNHRDREVPGS
jgi:hypothetical protein